MDMVISIDTTDMQEHECLSLESRELHSRMLLLLKEPFPRMRQREVSYSSGKKPLSVQQRVRAQRLRAQRPQRAHRSPTKRAKPSGSSDSDGGPSASDSSDRCILGSTPLLHFLCFSRISVVNTTAKSSIHIHYGHAIAVNITLLIRNYCAFLALFRIDMPTSFRMGSHHV